MEEPIGSSCDHFFMASFAPPMAFRAFPAARSIMAGPSRRAAARAKPVLDALVEG